MFLPHSSTIAILLIVVSMLCWGSWPNLLKTLPDWRLEFFYIDYTLGFLAAMLIISMTAGSGGIAGLEFVDRMVQSRMTEIIFAFSGGLVWNIGNIFLLNAIMVAGLAVAFPIASVLAIMLGVGISYWANPLGNPAWLLAGSVVLVLAAYFNAQAYRGLTDSPGSKRKLGIALSLAAGVLVGAFPPFVGRAIAGQYGLDAYTVCIYFMLGASVATFVGMPLLAARPFIGNAVPMKRYLEGSTRAHVLGWLAGAIWCVGTVSNFASAGLVGVAISWGIASGAPMIGALWGIFLWREFAGASHRAWTLIVTSLVLYSSGVVLVAISYARR